MTVDVVLKVALGVAAALLWITLSIFERRLPNPAWILAILLFLHDFARVLGGSESLLNSSVIGPAAIVAFVALPAVLRSPQKLLDAIREPAILLWVAFLAYSALSLLWSDNREYGLEKVLGTVGLGLLPGLAMYIVYRYSRRLSWNAVLLLGALFCMAALIQGETATGRLTTEDGNPIWIARAALLLVTIAIWDSRSRPWLRVLAGLLGLWVAVATQSRGPLLACIAAPLVILGISIAKNKGRSYRRTSMAMSTAGVAVLLALILVSPTEMTGGDRGESRLASLLHVAELVQDDNVVERLTLQRDAFTRFIESPIVGAGMGSSAPIGQRLYPHNVPLELASEVGIVGLLLWIAAILFGFMSSTENRLLRLLLLQVLFYSFTSGDLGANTLVVVLSVFCCAADVTRHALSSPMQREATAPVQGHVPVHSV